MKESNNPNGRISTYALGSCLGVTCYDPMHQIGALLHSMLPNRPSRGGENYTKAMCVDTGVPELLARMEGLGSKIHQCEFKIFGGAQLLAAGDYFKIGERNIQMMRQLATQYQLRVKIWHTGGQLNRTIRLHLDSGGVMVRMPGRPETIL